MNAKQIRTRKRRLFRKWGKKVTLLRIEHRMLGRIKFVGLSDLEMCELLEQNETRTLTL